MYFFFDQKLDDHPWLSGYHNDHYSGVRLHPLPADSDLTRLDVESLEVGSGLDIELGVVVSFALRDILSVGLFSPLRLWMTEQLQSGGTKNERESCNDSIHFVNRRMVTRHTYLLQRI